MDLGRAGSRAGVLLECCLGRCSQASRPQGAMMTLMRQMVGRANSEEG